MLSVHHTSLSLTPLRGDVTLLNLTLDPIEYGNTKCYVPDCLRFGYPLRVFRLFFPFPFSVPLLRICGGCPLELCVPLLRICGALGIVPV